MGNKDVISKSVLGHLAADIANLLLGFNVEMDSVELLETEQQRVEQRRADLVARMRRRDDGQTFILHIEIQNQNDSTMPLRMLRYFTDIQMAYPDEPIYQHLIYIGRNRLTMPDNFQAPAFTYRYGLLDMHTVDCSILLAQDTPDALVLAILCDFKGRPEQEMVNFIVLRLRELMGDDERGFRDYFEMLEALAENRDLQPNIEEADKMLTQVDVTRFASYQWGMRAGLTKGLEQGLERGIERGIQQGLERGIERGMKQGIERGMTQGVKIGKMEGKVEGRTEGEREKSRAIACNLLSLGVLAEADIAKVTGLTLEELQQIKNEH